MEVIPSNYYISKGSYDENTIVKDGDTINLECYEYVIEKGESGWYLAKCEELNAYVQGKNWNELKSNILEAHEEMLSYV